MALVGSHISQIVQVFFDKAEGGFKIRVVEFIGYTPTERAKLPSFNDDGVEVADCED